MSTSQSAAERRFALAVTAAFLLVAAVVMAYHEPWRDEMQAWLIARDSRSLGELLSRIRYEGHPALWYLALYAFQRLVAPIPAVMQGFHLLVAASAVAVVARYAPFSRTQRAAFAAGYFPLYEYGVIARNYSLSVALVMAACLMFRRRRNRVFALAIVLALLPHTTVYGTLFAAAFGAALLLEQCLPAAARIACRPPRAQVAGALLLMGVSAVLAVLEMRPPPDTGFATAWYTTLDTHRLEATLGTVRAALVPVHPLRVRYFDALVTDGRPRATLVADAFSLAVLVLALRALLRDRVALTFYLGAMVGLLAFTYVKYLGYLRHDGFALIALVAALWLAADARRQAEGDTGDGAARGLDVLTAGTLTTLLAVQVLAAAVACGLEIRYVFSYGRAAAEYLERRGLDTCLLAGEPDGNAAAVLGFLPHRRAYFPRADRFGTYVVWDTARLSRPPDPELVARVRAVAERERRDAILILGGRFPDSTAAATGLTLLISYPEAAVSGESFSLYLVRARAGGPGAR